MPAKTRGTEHRTMLPLLLGRLGQLQLRIVFQRKDLLNPLRPVVAFTLQNLYRLLNLVQPRVLGRAASGDTVENGGDVQEPRPALEEVAIQRLGRRQGLHHCEPPGAGTGWPHLRKSSSGRQEAANPWHPRCNQGWANCWANYWANCFFTSRFTSAFKLPLRKPSRSSVTNWKPSSRR